MDDKTKATREVKTIGLSFNNDSTRKFPAPLVKNVIKVTKRKRSGKNVNSNDFDQQSKRDGHQTGHTSAPLPKTLDRPGQGKSSFGSLYSTFSNIVRAKKNLRTKKRDRNANVTLEKEERELPKEPRLFSTGMSAEAQYAMMKCYEDTIYQHLCTEFPEYQLLLSRNETPVPPLDSSGTLHLRESNSAPKTDTLPIIKTDSQDLSRDGGLVADLDTSFEDLNERTNSPYNFMQKTDESGTNCQRKWNNLHVLQKDTLPSIKVNHNDLKPNDNKLLASNTTYPTRQNIPLTYLPKVRDKRVKGSRRARETSTRKMNCLPCIVPLEKQLQLTYQFQSAMDILDTMKVKNGMLCTSPRVKKRNEKLKPVSEYNRWTKSWSKEFTGVRYSNN